MFTFPGGPRRSGTTSMVTVLSLWYLQEVIWTNNHCSVQFTAVQSLSCLRLFATPWTAAHLASLSITNSRSLPKLMSIESVMLSNHLILGHPLLLPPSIFPSIRVFSNESVLYIRWPDLEFQLQHQSFQWTLRTNLLSDRLVGSPCSPRDSQESSTPQFKSINPSVLSFLYSIMAHLSFIPTLFG